MDSLIALGASASTAYGVYALYVIAYALGVGDYHGAHSAAMDLYFESAAMILTLITLGKYFESRAKAKTTDSLSHLIDLSPKTATQIIEGVEQQVPVETVRPGALLVVKAGEAVPVDGVIVDGAGSLDESVITGEPFRWIKKQAMGLLVQLSILQVGLSCVPSVLEIKQHLQALSA